MAASASAPEVSATSNHAFDSACIRDMRNSGDSISLNSASVHCTARVRRQGSLWPSCHFQLDRLVPVATTCGKLLYRPRLRRDHACAHLDNDLRGNATNGGLSHGTFVDPRMADTDGDVGLKTSSAATSSVVPQKTT